MPSVAPSPSSSVHNDLHKVDQVCFPLSRHRQDRCQPKTHPRSVKCCLETFGALHHYHLSFITTHHRMCSDHVTLLIFYRIMPLSDGSVGGGNRKHTRGPRRVQPFTMNAWSFPMEKPLQPRDTADFYRITPLPDGSVGISKRWKTYHFGSFSIGLFMEKPHQNTGS